MTKSKNHRQGAENIIFAKKTIGRELSSALLEQLRDITSSYGFSLRAGEILLLRSGWYVTHTGLIRLAARKHCHGIHVEPIQEFSDALSRRYAFKATVYKSPESPGFTGYGDADPSNVSYLVQGAEMRVAETRAVNRLCERRMESASALWKKSVPSINNPPSPLPNRRNSRGLPMATDTLLPPCATGFVRSFASMSSILIW